jgi:CBS domain-containing protein
MGNALVAPARVRLVASLNEPSVVADGACLDSGDSALCALTDFQQHDPITVEIDCSIEDALAEMSRWGVHALLVIQQALGGMDLQVVGLITRYDIERSHRRHDTAAPGEPNGIIRVGEVMTAWDELALVRYESLGTLAGRNLHEMFQGTGLTHLLVVEFRDDDSVVARGLLSRGALDKRRDQPPTPAIG